MKKILMIGLVTVGSCHFSFSQSVENKAESKATGKQVRFDLSGQITFAKDTKSNVFLTFGGPGVRFGRGNTALIIGMYPSVRYNYEYSDVADKTPVSTILGAGAQLSYRRLTGGCLFYLVKNMWYAAPAVGYKFK